MFFDLKTPKNGQKKYLKCPKQVGIDSQDLPGVGLCPSSCHDVEILLLFLIFLSKNGHFTQHGQNRQKATFSLFFCIFSYSESPLAWIFGSQGVSDPFLGGYEGWFVRTLRGSPKKSKCLKKIGVLPPPRGGGSQHLSLGVPCCTDSWASPFLLGIYMDILTGTS